MYIKNFLQVKFSIIILFAIANFSHCADFIGECEKVASLME